MTCVFCDYAGPNPVLEFLHECIIFEPLNPVAEGHVIVVPKLHVESVGKARCWNTEEREAVSNAFAAAAFWASYMHDSNIITSSGRAATQTVHHLHVHVIPRHEGDGLALPWTVSA